MHSLPLKGKKCRSRFVGYASAARSSFALECFRNLVWHAYGVREVVVGSRPWGVAGKARLHAHAIQVQALRPESGKSARCCCKSRPNAAMHFLIRNGLRNVHSVGLLPTFAELPAVALPAIEWFVTSRPPAACVHSNVVD